MIELDKLSLVYLRKKHIPQWILDIEDRIKLNAKYKNISFTISGGDMYANKDRDFVISAKDYCEHIQLIRYDWYDRFGCKYGKTIEGAQRWFDELQVPPPEEYFNDKFRNYELMSYDERQKLEKGFENSYKWYVKFKIYNPPHSFSRTVHNFAIWFLIIVGITIPYTVMYFLGMFFPNLSNTNPILFIVALCMNIFSFLIGKDYLRGRLNWRDNLVALIWINTPIIALLISYALINII